MILSDIWLNLARMGVILLTSLLAWLTYRSHLLLKEFQPPFNLLLSPLELASRMVLVGICLGLAWLSGLPPTRLGLVSTQPFRIIGLGLMIGVIVQVGLNWLTQWAINRFGPQIYSAIIIRNILPRRPLEWPLVALALLPAVTMEELLFRPLWLGLFQQIVPLPLLVVVTSFIFGFMHQPQGPLGMIVAVGINLIFSVMFIGSGEVWLPLVAHYIINLLQLITAYYRQDEEGCPKF